MNPEANLITAICKNNNISVILSNDADDLFVTHRDVWEEVRNYYFKHSKVPDISILETKFRDFEASEVKGEPEYFLHELRDHHIKLRLRNLLTTAGPKLNEVAGAELLQELQTEINQLAKYSAVVRDLDVTDTDDAVRHMENKSLRAEKMGGTPGIPTGIEVIDKFYPTGMAPGHLIVMIGWSGRGKTWFSTYLACKAWLQGYKPMIVSLEMSPEEMRDRIYTILGSGVFSHSDFARGTVNIDDFKGWAKKELHKDRNQFIIVSNEGGNRVTPMTVQAKIDQHRPDLVICDYHQLFDDAHNGRGMVEQTRNISRDFKLMAITNNIPIIDLSQATQDDTADLDNPPLIEQVAWSKGIQHDADLAIAVHKIPDSNLFTILSRKNRHGGEFEFCLDWDIDRGVIKEVVM